jgi:hypothetical protein
MDPLTTTIMTVLGKYVIDKGAALAKEVGQAAAEAAGKLFTTVMAKLKDTGDAKNAERYEKDSKGYEKPVADSVEEQIKADPDFARELQQLVEQFKQAGGANLVASNITVNASNNSNAVGSIQAGGNVGPITMGNTTNNRSGGVDFNVSGGSVKIGGKVVGGDLVDKGD